MPKFTVNIFEKRFKIRDRIQKRNNGTKPRYGNNVFFDFPTFPDIPQTIVKFHGD